MKGIVSVLAALIAIAGFINFYIGVNGHSPIPIALSHPLVMIAMAYLLFAHIFPATIYRGTLADRVHAVNAVLATGSPLAQTTCSGMIGSLRLSGPLLRVTIYPGGLLLKPILMPASALPKEMLTTIHVKKDWWSDVVEITHSASTLANPIQVMCGSTDPVRTILLTWSTDPSRHDNV